MEGSSCWFAPPLEVDMLLRLLTSHAILDFRLEKNGCISSSLGDSYALGMAGTGGTISSSPSERFSPRIFSVGSLEVEKLCDMRAVPLEARAEL